MKKFFTSESVTEGHPDKLCDYISDSILDAFIEKDENARVACETVAGKGEILVTGEITSNVNESSESKIDIESIVRKTIRDVGYGDEKIDIDPDKCNVRINISKQSPDIAIGVDKSLEKRLGENISSEGAGDQGIMFGFACDETENYMPMPIYLAHNLSRKLAEVRKTKQISGLRPDGKTQVTIEYEDDKVKRVDTVVLSTQHEENVDLNIIKQEIIEKIIKSTIPQELLDEKTRFLINPTGRFLIGGPYGDAGLTGRKIIVDTYGGYSRHGGGAFSGKDPTKVDRSASYMARHISKCVVANGYAKKCEIQLSYSIGVARPVSIFLDTFHTATISEDEIIKKIENTFDLTPTGIIKYLDLKKPIYKMTTNYGHFGKENLSWEKIKTF